LLTSDDSFEGVILNILTVLRRVVIALSIIAKEVEEGEEVLSEGIAVCGTHLSTPVVDTSPYINEIHYKVGNRLYIENAD
jgi:hypothetical protein